MNPESFLRTLERARGVAILRTQIAEAALPAMEAAIRGGFQVVEVTLGTPGALRVIAALADREAVVVGAGTVLTAEDARLAVEHGARFLVSPVVDEAVITQARELGVACMPGAQTPTEMLRAHRAGASLQKLFPAPADLPTTIGAILGPLPFLRIVPTSGVHEHNARACLDAGAFAVGFVGSLFTEGDLRGGAFDRIEERARLLLGSIHPG